MTAAAAPPPLQPVSPPMERGPAPAAVHPPPMQMPQASPAVDPKTGLMPPQLQHEIGLQQPRPMTGQSPYPAGPPPVVAPAPQPRTNGASPPPNGAAPANAAPPAPPRPAPDFTNLPPAIAESLARLAGSLPRKPN
jgi:hypothetical protein